MKLTRHVFLFTFLIGALLVATPLFEGTQALAIVGTMGNDAGENGYFVLDTMCLSRFTVPTSGRIDSLKVHGIVGNPLTNLEKLSVAVYTETGCLDQFSYPIGFDDYPEYSEFYEIPLRVSAYVEAGDDLYFTVWGNRYTIFYNVVDGSENYVVDYEWNGGAFPVEAPIDGVTPSSWQFAISADIHEVSTPTPTPSTSPSTSPTPSPSTSPDVSPSPTPYSTATPSPSPLPEVSEFLSPLPVVGVLLMVASVAGYFVKRKSKKR